MVIASTDSSARRQRRRPHPQLLLLLHTGTSTQSVTIDPIGRHLNTPLRLKMSWLHNLLCRLLHLDGALRHRHPVLPLRTRRRISLFRAVDKAARADAAICDRHRPPRPPALRFTRLIRHGCSSSIRRALLRHAQRLQQRCIRPPWARALRPQAPLQALQPRKRHSCNGNSRNRSSSITPIRGVFVRQLPPPRLRPLDGSASISKPLPRTAPRIQWLFHTFPPLSLLPHSCAAQRLQKFS